MCLTKYETKSLFIFSPSPWKKIIRLIGTFLPLGLLLATLTPNVVRIDNTTTWVVLLRFSFMIIKSICSLFLMKNEFY